MSEKKAVVGVPQRRVQTVKIRVDAFHQAQPILAWKKGNGEEVNQEDFLSDLLLKALEPEVRAFKKSVRDM